MVLAVVDFKRVTPSLDHDSLVELFQELDLTSCLVEGDLHQSLARMHVDKGHRDTVRLNDVEQKHDAVADLELSNLVVFQHVL